MEEYYINLEVAYQNEFPDVNYTKFPILSVILTSKNTMNSKCMIMGEQTRISPRKLLVTQINKRSRRNGF